MEFIFLDVTSAVGNLTNMATTYTTQQITDAIQSKILSAFLKLGAGLLIAAGLSSTQVKELKALAIIVFSIFGAFAAIDFLQAISATLTQTMP